MGAANQQLVSRDFPGVLGLDEIGQIGRPQCKRPASGRFEKMECLDIGSRGRAIARHGSERWTE